MTVWPRGDMLAAALPVRHAQPDIIPAASTTDKRSTGEDAMTQNHAGGMQMLQNLATALRQQQNSSHDASKRPAATDQDILRAMLGKRWETRPVEATELRKAG